MNNRQGKIINLIYMVGYGLMALAVILYILFRTDVFDNDGVELLPFSADWRTEDGKSYQIDDIRMKNFGGSVTVENTIPAGITDSDAICFQSKNCSIRVFIDDKEVYSFIPRENLTGIGYGVAFHDIGITKEDAGKTIKMHYEGALRTYGSIVEVYVCPASAYVRMMVMRTIPDLLLSFAVIFFGIVLMAIFAWMPDKDSLPFNLAAVGAVSVVLGVWFFLDTNIPQLLTGKVYACRVLSRVFVYLAGYPVISFYNSITKLRRKIYAKISFWMSLFFAAVAIGLRYIIGYDMMFSFVRIIIVYVSCLIILAVIMTVDNARYCRETGIESGLRGYLVIILVFLSCCLADIVVSMLRLHNYSYIFFAKLGMILFIIFMLYYFLRWWIKDQSDIERDRFINRALQYAIASDAPDAKIKLILEYLGKELHARHVFIMEDQHNGKFRGTYEWGQPGKESAGVDLLYLPYGGLVDRMYDYYLQNGKLIVSDAEEYREISPAFYNILKTNDIDNMVINPLVINSRLSGILGLTGAPDNALSSVEEITKTVSTFLAQLVAQRDEQSRLFFFSYNDAVTKARNRRAFRKFVDEDIDLSSSFGYLKCDMKGLELINSALGYEAGDKLVIDMAAHLMEVFGEANVYRLSGSEFTAFGFEVDETIFFSDVARVKKLFADDDIKVNTGAVFCANGTKDMSKVMKRADELIQEERAAQKQK